MRPEDGGAKSEGAAGADERPSAWERFAEHLVEVGLLAADEIEPLRREAQAVRLSLPELLLRSGRCEAPRLREELAEFFGVEAVAGEEIPLDPALMLHFPGELLVRLKCVPLTLVGSTMRMGMVDPSDEAALRALRALVPVTIWPVVALERDVCGALERSGARGDGGDGGDPGGSVFGDPVRRAGEAIADGRPAEALELLEEVVRGEPPEGTDGGRRFSFATVEEQQVFTAERPEREVEWLDPGFGFARYLRGVALGDLGRLEEAARELQAALDWNPVSDRAHLELGWVEAQRGRHEAAVGAFTRAAALYEAGARALGAQAHRGRGYCLAALGRRDEAVAAYRRSLELDAKSEIALDAMAGLSEPSGPTPAPATDELTRLAAATATGALTWAPDEDAAADERGFTCRDGDRTITLSRRGKRYRLVIRERAGADAGAKIEEEQDGLLKRSRRLKPLFGVVARRTRVLER